MRWNMSKKNLLILGAEQYGHVVKETAEATGCFGSIAFLDDNNPAAIGKLLDYRRLRQEYDCAFVAMGNSRLRMHWLRSLKAEGFALPVLVHPKAYISPSAVLREGTIAEAMAVVNTGAVVETGGLLCAGCVVNHNARVSCGCQIDCNAVVAAGAVVPEGTKVPAGTVFEKQ